MNFCTKCGNKLEESWTICPNCGNKIEELKEIKEPKQEDIIPQQETPIPYRTTIIDKKKISEEKLSIKNKKVVILSISLAVVCVLAGVLGILFITTNNKYNDLTGDYDDLLNNYQILTGDYDTLFDDYQDLQNSYNAICLVIKQSILPVQYSIFAEAVRRYYLPIYLTDDLTNKEWYMGYVEFCRDIVLHDSRQYNDFSEVSNAFSDALRFGSDTMYLADYIMIYTFDWCNTIDYWGLDELSGSDDLTIIDIVVQQCIDEFDYEYDSDIIIGQENPTWDYPKFPVETAFRTKGDCEDQAILTAAYLESCGLETAIMIFHDPSHPTIGEFYHGVPLVHIEDTSAFWSNYPSCGLWRFSNGPYYPEYTWCFLDPTWDIPFGSEPSWLNDYGGYIYYSFCSIAFCDIDGAIGENIGLTCVMPT